MPLNNLKRSNDEKNQFETQNLFMLDLLSQAI